MINKNPLNYKILLISKRLLGFLLLFGLAILIELLIVGIISAIFNTRLMPRGIGWIIIPIILGTYGWRSAHNFTIDTIKSLPIINKINGTKGITRYYIAASAFWTLIASAYSILSDTVNSYHFKWELYLQILIIPLVFLFIGKLLLQWAKK